MTRSATLVIFALLTVSCSSTGLSSCVTRAKMPVSAAAQAAAPTPVGETVIVPDLFRVTVPGPGRWVPVRNGRILLSSPPTVLLLAGVGFDAAIRFHIYDPDEVTSGEVLLHFLGQFDEAGIAWALTSMSSERGGPISAVFEDKGRGIRGKIAIRPVPGSEHAGVVMIGLWQPDLSRAMIADFDAVFASIAPPPGH